MWWSSTVALVYQVFLCCIVIFMTLDEGSVAPANFVQLSEAFGGPYGTEFSDQATATAGLTIGSLTIYAGKRLDGLVLEVTGPTPNKVTHGKARGTGNVLKLDPGEAITSMEVHWDKKENGYTTVFYIKFHTSTNRSLSSGSMTDSKGVVVAPSGFQLGGFFGRDGDEIGNVGAIWTLIAVDTSHPVIPPTPAPPDAPLSKPGPAVGSTASAPTETKDPAKVLSRELRSAADPTASAPAEPKDLADLLQSEPGPAADPAASAPAETTDLADLLQSEPGSTANSTASAPAEPKDLADLLQSESGPAADPAASAPAETTDLADLLQSEPGSTANSTASAPAEPKDLADLLQSESGPAADPAASAPAETTDLADLLQSEPGSTANSTASAPAEPKDLADLLQSESGPAADPAASAPAETTDLADLLQSEPGSTANSTASAPAEPKDLADLLQSESGPAADPAASAPAETTDPAKVHPSETGSAANSTVSAPAETKAPDLTMAVENSIVRSKSFGGPHGREFSDQNLVNSGQTVKSLIIYVGKRLDGISLEISAPKPLTFTHGGTGGARKELKLLEDEHITSMEVHWNKYKGDTRIFYVKFVTSAGNSLDGGSVSADKETVTACEGFQLAGFFGRDGKEIDSLGAIWAYIDLVTPPPTPPPAPVTIDDSPGATSPPDAAEGLSEVKVKVNKRAVQLSDSFGGPHGKEFSDQIAITSGMIITSVTIRGGKRINGFKIEVSVPKKMTFAHGGGGGTDHTMMIDSDEYITTMDVHWDKRNGKTCVFYMRLGTNKGKSLTVGSQTLDKGSVTAPMGYQLAGFYGRCGDEIDHVGAVWSSIAKVNETVFAPAAEDNIVLSDLLGGPHGVAFSDINGIKFGQTISSVTIRTSKRLNSVTLRISAPEEKTWNHGGGGGAETTLILAEDEAITSVEAYWGQKDGHTRIFYICFTTNAGKTLSGGTQTKDKTTLTPPEGFVLGGFFGNAGTEVDRIGMIWIRENATQLLLTDPTAKGNGTYGTTIRNWVGPTIHQVTDTSCYRKSVDFAPPNICPLGYGNDELDCIAHCPMAYPVECDLECLPQNDDCALAVMTKIGAVVDVALNVASAGVAGEIRAAYKTSKRVILCSASIMGVIKNLLYYIRYRQITAPEGTQEELLTAAYQANVAVFDLPIAICVCLGMDVPNGFKFSNYVLMAAQAIVKQAVTNGDVIISSAANVMKLLHGQGMVDNSTITVDEVEGLIAKNTTCGYELKRLTDRVTAAVLKYRNTTDSLAAVRVKVYESPIVLNDIPIVTNNCMGELLAHKTITTAYETRELFRKTFGVIVDQLINTGKTDNGTHVAEDEYRLQVANMGLVALSVIDPFGLANLAAQFVQPICGPTAYLGEIDDGTLFDALGLRTVDEVFEGSYGMYTHAGDGVIQLIFESVDTKDVTVVIHSGGDQYSKVDVGAGDTTKWESTFPELQDKTMYLDRWRPGIMGLPGTGGGSLVIWIPRSSEGGHMTMHVRINPV